jgi:hypothetical protein
MYSVPLSLRLTTFVRLGVLKYGRAYGKYVPVNVIVFFLLLVVARFQTYPRNKIRLTVF